MSSILDALKKAEQTSKKTADFTDHLAETKPVFTRQQYPSQKRSFFPAWLFVFTMAGFVFFFLLSVLLSPNRTKHTELKVTESAHRFLDLKQQSVTFSHPSDHETINRSDLQINSDKKKNSPQIKQERMPPVGENTGNMENTTSIRFADKSKRPSLKYKPAKELLSPINQDSAESSDIFDRKTTSSLTDPEPIVHKDLSLNVQAISWNENPEMRVAVINNKILSEKDIFSGYKVIRIEKDRIVVEKSGLQFSLFFNYR